MERNDRNNSQHTDDSRRGQGQQSFHRNPQRPPSPDYRRQQRENAGFDRNGERPRQQTGSSRMNVRTPQNSRLPERRYELPDVPQQRRDPREAALGDERRSPSGFSSRDGTRQSVGERERQGNAPYSPRDRQERGRDGGNFRPNDRPREQVDFSRDPRSARESRAPVGDGNAQRAPRRFESREALRQPQEPSREPRRENRRFENRGQTRTAGRNDPRERPAAQTRNPHDDHYYDSPRASDPRRNADRTSRYDGLSEGGVDMGSFDINYRGDAAGGQNPAAAAGGILTRPVIIAVFAVAALMITVIIFAVFSSGGKNKTAAPSGTGKKYEYNIPDTVTVGGMKIDTDSDYIELADMNLTDVSDLSYCYLVSSLFINGNSISDLSPIGDCISLKTLDANSNQISDISALAGLSQLSDLDLSSNSVSDLSPLSNLRQLERFSAEKNRITDLSPLSRTTALRQLIVSDNQIADLTSLAALNSLTTLEAANNQITDILALSGLDNLSTLNLSGNQIADIKALKTLSSLTMLDLSDNPVKDVSPLKGLTGLLELNLTGTKVTKEDIAELKKSLPECQIRN